MGAGPSDGNEIKKHPWFNGVDWKKVYAKKLNPPKPIIKTQSNLEFKIALNQKTEEVNGKKIDGWSFLNLSS